MKLTILSSGPLSTIQDAGWYGSMSTGFSSGGAMVAYSIPSAMGSSLFSGAVVLHLSLW